MTTRLVVMVSGSGSNLQALLDARRAGELAADVVAVVADNPQAYAIQRALDALVPVICVPLPKGMPRVYWAGIISDLMTPFRPDLVIMAGWMRIMPAAFVERWTPNLINQHPALLPEDASPTYVTAGGQTIPAIRGAHAVRDALRLGVPMTGCTIHQVTPEVDVGPVLARVEVPVLPGDDEASLHERIKLEERPLLVSVVNRLAGR